MEFSVTRDMRGNYRAETEVGQVNKGALYTLIVTTLKTSSGELVTNATCAVVEGNLRTFMPFSDFSRSVERNRVRCTERNVREQHARCLTMKDALLAEAARFYSAKEK